MQLRSLPSGCSGASAKETKYQGQSSFHFSALPPWMIPINTPNSTTHHNPLSPHLPPIEGSIWYSSWWILDSLSHVNGAQRTIIHCWMILLLYALRGQTVLNITPIKQKWHRHNNSRSFGVAMWQQPPHVASKMSGTCHCSAEGYNLSQKKRQPRFPLWYITDHISI